MYWIFPLLLYTLQGIYLKFISKKEVNKIPLSFVYNVIVFFLCVIIFRFSFHFTIPILLYSLINGVSYGLSVWLTLEALKVMDVSVFYPIRRLNNPIVAILLAIVLHEILKITQIIAVILAVISVLVFQTLKLPKKELKYTILVLFLMVMASFFSKLGSYSKEEFMSFSYLISSLTLIVLMCITKQFPKKDEIGWGVLAGIINFTAFFSLLYALEKLPGSLVYPLVGANLILISFFASILFKEKLTKRWGLAFILAISSFFLAFL